MAADESDPKIHPHEDSKVSEADPERAQNSKVEYKRHPLYYPSEWLFEAASSLLAMGLRKPLSDWNARVSLSATISILTTAYTTALMHGVSSFIAQLKWLYFKDRPKRLSHLETFDGASRGVWGSILLLTNVKWNLATIGAVVTILRLTFSLFAQQVVLREQRELVESDASAMFGYAHDYSRNLGPGIATARVESTPQDPGMQSAIVQDSYVSLGFKSTCQNVTQKTLRTATCSEREGVGGHCNMTTPSGLGLSYQYVFTASGTSYYMNATSLLDFLGTSDLPETFPELARFGIYRSSGMESLGINITECSLSLTAYQYNTVKANGNDFSFGDVHGVDIGLDGRNPWRNVKASNNYFGRIATNETTVNGTDTIPELVLNSVTEWVSGDWENTDLGFAAALGGDADILARFEHMAAAMTDYLRNDVPFVAIRWGYFVVPIVTEALAVLFAVLTVLSNRKSKKVPVWKSSSLAVLACQVDEPTGLLRGDAGGKDLIELQEVAEKTQVRLQ
ncbi:DUF3176 domain-containing protein [Aspergillus foveolatus]|uniref:DUF3176 domain-containing protein n=1 Tax=Aspergillus foveolatus TaxID=210207 RepID=UPI003CCE48F0